MIADLKLNEKYLRDGWKGSQEDLENLINKTLKQFKVGKYPAYKINTDIFLHCFEGYEGRIDLRQPKMVDYGHAFTMSAIEKYIDNEYGDNDPTKYMIQLSLIDFDYENLYREGCFIDGDGVRKCASYDDLYDIEPNIQLIDKPENAEYENCFIGFSILQLPEV